MASKLPLLYHIARDAPTPYSLGFLLLSAYLALTFARLTGLAGSWAATFGEAALCGCIARVCTAAAFPSRGTAHGILGFFPALIIGEAPVHVAAAVAYFFFGRTFPTDDLALWRIRAITGAVSLAAVAYLAVRQSSSRSTLTNAARAAGFRTRFLSEPLDWQRTIACILPPLFWIAARGAKRTHNIVFQKSPRYTLPGGEENKEPVGAAIARGRSAPLPAATPVALSMDLLTPPKGTPLLGGICYVHGGGWVTGSKNYASLPLLAGLVSRGFMVATVDYRLAPRVGVQDQAEDVRAAARALRILLPPGSLVALAGESAGAHLAALAVLGTDGPRGSSSPGKAHHPSPSVPIADAVVGLCGVFDFTDSGGHWASRAGGGAHSFFRFIERFVLRESVSADGGARSIACASPFWLALGPAQDKAAREARLRVPPPTSPRAPSEPVIVRDNTRARAHLSGFGGILRFFAPIAAEKSDSTAKDACFSPPETNGAPTASSVSLESVSSVPPFCLIHGLKDSVVPVEESLRLMAALNHRRGFALKEERSAPCDAIAILDGASHAHTYMPSPRTFAVADFVADWLCALAKSHKN
jgi:acetyl esterase/lipase